MTRLRRRASFVLLVAAVMACRSAGAAGVRPALAPDDLQTGIALYQQGKYVEAEGVLRRAAGPQAQAYLAASLAKQRRYAEALGPAEAALAEDPVHDVAVAALGESLVGQKKYDDAVGRLSSALAARPDLAYAYLWRGQAYQHQKQTARMIADFESFLRLAPKAPEAGAVKAVLSSLK
jgi:tetratricopeptide (TPR) repeat protein